ncbi:hypothetical protein KM043_008351 [Ampulex compressa]|nr:hypothetical protein KM043_008351 [Ampulex compressa]
MRPPSLTSYVGQKRVIGPNTVLRQLLDKGQIPSIILWGPPGCGKSSLANVICSLSKEICNDKVHIVNLSAVTCGVNDIRDAVAIAGKKLKYGCKTVVLIDEIHRFNKLQQDIFLPHVEAGTFTLIGTTTENPSYSLNSALLSRCRVFVLNKLTIPDVTTILCKAITFTEGVSTFTTNLTFGAKAKYIIDKETVEWLAEVCDGDARVALCGLELAIRARVPQISNNPRDITPKITLQDIKDSLKTTHTLYDKDANQSHHLYSALCKSIRAGKANASLYWLARIMAVKEDPVNIARRLVRISSEDVGLADPDALGIAVHTMHGCQMIGMPECDVLLGQCAVYLAKAPKSRLMYNALKAAEEVIYNHKGPQPSVPLHIKCRSGEGKLQASLGRAKSNLLRKEDSVNTCLPPELAHVNFYE